MSELEKSVSLKKPLCKKNIFLWVIPLLLSVATVAVGAILRGKSFLWVSALITVYSLAPFFISFEMRKPKAKELVTLAVLCALAAASRAAFIWFPNFKPMAGVIFITALALGPTSGFLCGALSVLASNFIFGQGPWTPFQMLSFGLGGPFLWSAV